MVTRRKPPEAHQEFLRNAPANLTSQEIAEYLFRARAELRKTRSWERYVESRPFGLSRPSINRYIHRHEEQNFPSRPGRPANLRVPVDDPEALLQELMLRFHRMIVRLPSSKRMAFFRSAAGMMATVVGLEGKVTISALPVPENYVPQPQGRPHKDRA